MRGGRLAEGGEGEPEEDEASFFMVASQPLGFFLNDDGPTDETDGGPPLCGAAGSAFGLVVPTAAAAGLAAERLVRGRLTASYKIAHPQQQHLTFW